jgi:uncharacterized protein
MKENENQRYTNRLVRETSPYLLQHAHNPVDWYPWGNEALEKARAEDLPILLSIGYSACHWCHVMERESFENPETAAIMNGHFICIKVDREERPDLDDIYMAATVAMNNGQGGWPMTVFLTPGQEPFFAGTYFPPVDRYGRPGFPTLLMKIAEAWKNDRPALLQQGKTLADHLRAQAGAPAPESVGRDLIEAAATQLSREFDPAHGGFGSAPKFPPSAQLALLLRHHRRTGDALSLQVVRVTLDAMAGGGLYDQIGGGFSRYSTDDRWLVPHFEKMLYDNALLARIYLEAYQVTGSALYERIAKETLDYILREMTDPEGGFYCATDADSEGVEGKFFVWTPSEIRQLLNEKEALWFCAYYDITEQGNWEGRSIPNTPRPADALAARFGVEPAEFLQSIDESRDKVYRHRLTRIPPGLDDKILTAWNGLMIGAMAEGARILGDRRYLQAAEKASDFIFSNLKQPDGRLLRTCRAGKAHLNAYLEDYAYLSEALIDLYEAGAHPRYLLEALRLAEAILSDFESGDGGGFYSTARNHEPLIVRSREGHDGAVPSPNACAASALVRLSYHFGRDDLRKAGTGAIEGYGKIIHRAPRAFCRSLAVVDFLLDGPVEIAAVGGKDDPSMDTLRREISRHYLPNRILAHLDPARPGEEGVPPLPLLEGKGLPDGKSAVYICRNFTCRTPVTAPDSIGPALEDWNTIPEHPS